MTMMKGISKPTRLIYTGSETPDSPVPSDPQEGMEAPEVSIEDSNLVRHARKELTLAGFFKPEADVMSKAIAEDVLSLIRVLADQDHSGGSHSATVGIFMVLARFQTLTAITDSKEEWMDVSGATGGEAMWQSTRNPALFSTDSGKTYYSVDDPDRKIKISKLSKQAIITDISSLNNLSR